MKASSPFLPFCFNRKAWQVGLWSIWLSGFLLISVSFYATQLLPYSIKDQIKGSGFRASPTISICTAPGPFSGSVGSRQALAVRSWLALSSDVTVVLFSQDPSAFSFARGFGSRVFVEPNIDFTFLGTPFFHSMVARSQASGSDISVIIDPEIIIFPDFISTLALAHKLDHDWLLFASSRHVPHFPFHLDEDGKHWLGEDDKHITNKKLQGFLTEAGQWKPCEEKILLAWNNGDLPLHTGVLPPFLFRKGLHNHWIINEALSSGFRFVFDASWTVSNFYLNASDNTSPQLFRDSNITKIGKRSWENLGNSHLATLYGSMFFHEANYSSLVKFLKCNGRYLFVNSVERLVYPMGYQRLLSLGKEMVLESLTQKKIVDCVNGFRSVDGMKDCSMKAQLKPSMSLSFPFSLEMLLPMLADQNKTIVLAVAGFSYKDMLMSWVCRLRRLLISNFLVFALDHEIYDFAVLQGVPVFKDSLAPTNISFNNCHFGTTCFQKVTKVKSRAVLQILKLGYNVLLSDVDVYWFKNPLPFLFSFGPNILVAQSDEYNKTGPINLPRRLNSGFYFAHADGVTVAALDKVVKHAAISNLSEQPSFYDTLCGEGGSNRMGNNQCLEPETNLTVHFLDTDLFPNGAYQGLWEDKNVKQTCEEKGCFVLHNNWISGRRKKLERQLFSGLWEYDISSRMCMKSWQKAKASSPEQQWRCQVKERRVGRYVQSTELSSASKNITVRIIHAGGHEEQYRKEVSACKLMEKYPGMVVARPEVFRRPHESLLSAEEKLLPGNKYYIIPRSTVRKLQRRHSVKCRGKKSTKSKELLVDENITDSSEDWSQDSVRSARDFYVFNEKWSRSSPSKGQRRKNLFVPPIPKPRICKGLGWEPSLTSVQEISP